MSLELKTKTEIEAVILDDIKKGLGISTMCKELGIVDRIQKIEFVLNNLELLLTTEKSINDAIGNLTNTAILFNGDNLTIAKKLFEDILTKGQDLSERNKQSLNNSIQYFNSKIQAEIQNKIKVLRAENN
jgi:hypothetical protein